MQGPGAALLVLAHDPVPLGYLLRSLDPAVPVFIHLDAKCATEPAALALPPQARLVQPRVEVFWGGWSMMQATLALIDAALDAGPWERLVLVSGDSLPIRSSLDLAAALAEPDAEYVELLDVADDPVLAGAPMQAAIDRHGWVQPWRFHNAVAWDHVLLNPFTAAGAAARYGVSDERMDWIRGEAQQAVAAVLAALPPRPRLFRRLCYGAQWWALSRAVLTAILPTLRRPEVIAYFRHMQAPDEHMIQTVLANRPDLLGGRRILGTPIFTDHGARARGQDWLDTAGFRAARAQGGQLLFARKFRPDRAPDLAAAIDAGRPIDEVLAG